MAILEITRRATLILAFGAAIAPFTLSARAEPLPADAVLGVWEADDGTVKLEMFKAGAEFQARMLYGNEIVEADNKTFKKDLKNPNVTLRSRSLKDVVFITGLRWSGAEWVDGSLYNPASGSTYNCKIEIKSGKLHLRGYMGIPAMGQTRVFRRASK